MTTHFDSTNLSGGQDRRIRQILRRRRPTKKDLLYLTRIIAQLDTLADHRKIYFEDLQARRRKAEAAAAWLAVSAGNVELTYCRDNKNYRATWHDAGGATGYVEADGGVVQGGALGALERLHEWTGHNRTR